MEKTANRFRNENQSTVWTRKKYCHHGSTAGTDCLPKFLAWWREWHQPSIYQAAKLGPGNLILVGWTVMSHWFQWWHNRTAQSSGHPPSIVESTRQLSFSATNFEKLQGFLQPSNVIYHVWLFDRPNPMDEHVKLHFMGNPWNPSQCWV